MMTKIDALRAMKAKRGEQTIILFHNGNLFEAYERDAFIVASIAGRIAKTVDSVFTVRIAEDEVESVSNKILDAGHALCISESRDSDGQFVVNVNTIEDE